MFIANGQSGLIKLRWYRCDTNVVNELNENDDAQGENAVKAIMQLRLNDKMFFQNQNM